MYKMSGPGEGKIKLGKADVYIHIKGKMMYSHLYSSYTIYLPNGGISFVEIPLKRCEESAIFCSDLDWSILEKMADTDNIGLEVTSHLGRPIKSKRLIIPLYVLSRTIEKDMSQRDKLKLVS